MKRQLPLIEVSYSLSEAEGQISAEVILNLPAEGLTDTSLATRFRSQLTLLGEKLTPDWGWICQDPASEEYAGSEPEEEGLYYRWRFTEVSVPAAEGWDSLEEEVNEFVGEQLSILRSIVSLQVLAETQPEDRCFEVDI